MRVISQIAQSFGATLPRSVASVFTTRAMLMAGLALASANGKFEARAETAKGAEAESSTPEHKGTESAADGDAKKAPAKTSSVYVHAWVQMPSFTATQLGESTSSEIKSQEGRMLVILFLASWSEPCQQIIEDYQKLEKRFERLPIDFVYVFAHDTKEDAEGFMQEFKMKDAVLANRDALKAFKNPKLPTVYVGDRRGFLTTRYVAIGGKDLRDLDEFLKLQTSY